MDSSRSCSCGPMSPYGIAIVEAAARAEVDARRASLRRRLACGAFAGKPAKNPVKTTGHRLGTSTVILANPFVIALRASKPRALLFAATDPPADEVDVGDRSLSSVLSEFAKRQGTPPWVTVRPSGNPNMLRERVNDAMPHMESVQRELTFAPGHSITPGDDGGRHILAINRVHRQRTLRYRPNRLECREQLLRRAPNDRPILDLPGIARCESGGRNRTDESTEQCPTNTNQRDRESGVHGDDVSRWVRHQPRSAC